MAPPPLLLLLLLPPLPLADAARAERRVPLLARDQDVGGSGGSADARLLAVVASDADAVDDAGSFRSSCDTVRNSIAARKSGLRDRVSATTNGDATFAFDDKLAASFCDCDGAEATCGRSSPVAVSVPSRRSCSPALNCVAASGWTLNSRFC